MFRNVSPLERSQWTDGEKWSFITNNALRMLSAGMLCGGAVGFVVFRSLAARAAAISFGAGCGVGTAYVDAKYILGHDVVGVERRTAEVVLAPSAATAAQQQQQK